MGHFTNSAVPLYTISLYSLHGGRSVIVRFRNAFFLARIRVEERCAARVANTLRLHIFVGTAEKSNATLAPSMLAPGDEYKGACARGRPKRR
ncbi:hypothetical protein PsYK624_155510 [Phanerochaete sordida]|uniref:Uncharacterized protein n=1 Tax=Phanerochaete sordida TaxID=48140 RepID=A0A9P3LL42_9APHY|nr:hypothetical protein PsYK624_155510 [Phanerochaete sordida]